MEDIFSEEWQGGVGVMSLLRSNVFFGHDVRNANLGLDQMGFRLTTIIHECTLVEPTGVISW